MHNPRKCKHENYDDYFEKCTDCGMALDEIEEQIRTKLKIQGRIEQLQYFLSDKNMMILYREEIQEELDEWQLELAGEDVK